MWYKFLANIPVMYQSLYHIMQIVCWTLFLKYKTQTNNVVMINTSLLRFVIRNVNWNSIIISTKVKCNNVGYISGDDTG